MEDREYKNLILDYAPDDYTRVHAIDLRDDLKQIVEVNLERYFNGEIRHYEKATYKEIFYENYFAGLTDCIGDYDYYLFDYPGLSDDILEQDLSFLHEKDIEYIKYVSQWYKEHSEGQPACYSEWADNENEVLNTYYVRFHVDTAVDIEVKASSIEEAKELAKLKLENLDDYNKLEWIDSEYTHTENKQGDIID